MGNIMESNIKYAIDIFQGKIKGNIAKGSTVGCSTRIALGVLDGVDVGAYNIEVSL